MNRDVQRLSAESITPLFQGTQRSRIALLQGPVGPFFKKLQSALENNNCDVWRICFNAGDRFFSKSKNRINFCGDLIQWHKWFSDFIAAKQIDVVILFGSERDIHSTARRVAELANVRVISLEEGYIRPGYITAEDNGNNISSPLAGRIPDFDFTPSPSQNASTFSDFKGFKYMSWYGALYFTIRTLFTLGEQKQLFHRKFAPGQEIFHWLRNAYRRVFNQKSNNQIIERLIKSHNGKYYIVPLQVAADSNMREAAMGWTSNDLIYSTIKSFSQHAPADSRLVFKIHPMDRGHSDHARLIKELAQSFNVCDRTEVIDSGSLGVLVRHAMGMITINSTSGLSAITHGTPLLIIGNAFYAHPQHAICAQGKADYLDTFWSTKHVANENHRKKYIQWIKHHALKQGDFYAPAGIYIACQNIILKLQEKETVEQAHPKMRATC